MHAIAKNTFLLLVLQVSGYVIPLLELPLLSRALGPAAYGSILYVQAIALVGAVILEYGFNISAARTVALERDNPASLRQLLANITGAKLMLAGGLTLVGVVVFLLGEGGTAAMPLEFCFVALVFFMAFGFSPFWYFQGRERMIGVVFVDLALRGTAVLCMYLLVRTPDDAIIALGLQAAAGFLNTSLQSYWMMRDIGWQRPSWRGGLQQLREGWNGFLYKGGSNVLTSMNVALLGGLSSPAQVGIFVPTEKVIRAGVGLSMPLSMALYPHVSRSFAQAPRRAMWLAARVIVGASALALAGAIVAYVAADWLVELAFGASYTGAAEVMRVLIWLFPLRVACQFMALMWLIPSGADRYASRVMLGVAALAAVSAVMVVPLHGALGMAVVAVASEFLQLLLLLHAVLRGRQKAIADGAH